MSDAHKPIIIVTGANGGVGYGICQRLLVQLSEESPPDSLPQAFSDIPQQDGEPLPKASFYPGLTLIMACRSVKRAEKAKDELLAWFDQHVKQRRRQTGYTGRAEEVQRNLVVDVVPLDLASVKTVFEFAKTVKERYPYVSHIAANAGLASFKSIDWIGAMKQLFTDPMGAMTSPNYYTQHAGELSVDGLGWVWQCNLFGHYTLFRELESHLAASPLGGRMIWCSSLEANPTHYDSSDWQLRSTDHSYSSVKYQIDLVATTLDRIALSSSSSTSSSSTSQPSSITPSGKLPVRHFISHPAVSHTNVSAALVGPITNFLKLLVFYIVRFLGSPHHPIQPYKAAIATTHLALVPLVYLAYLSQPTAPPVRYGAETDRWGNERVGISPVRSWLKYQDEGRALVEKCDLLVEKMREEESRPLEFETASERM
ncbi:3-keto sterol reductase [Coprinopsis cinerea okayama7|uniref:3beta-hydroxysteroid 3-dehydrogenase n=1 Tax=Coprinopsis cinerea (strain Okayama-7 / 130 / ATCC MYA-4618 / FGSC 9003) TaxID=240176 RepID=A8PGT7_COPC7|nr:3-keto sterol reductase [Coprinopsis cinerea okayama7\|eukprot:XP_001841278.1 3-keto sterol reductase [Coprinopsis cinerea okayama7\